MWKNSMKTRIIVFKALIFFPVEMSTYERIREVRQMTLNYGSRDSCYGCYELQEELIN